MLSEVTNIDHLVIVALVKGWDIVNSQFANVMKTRKMCKLKDMYSFDKG